MTRDEVMQHIDKAYQARRKNSLGAVDDIVAVFDPEGSFRIVGAPEHSPAAVHAVGHDSLRAAMQSLVGVFDFLRMDMLDSVVEGRRAVIHWSVRLRYLPTGEEIDTELCDVWRLGPDGRVLSLNQFCDTARAASLMA